MFFSYVTSGFGQRFYGSCFLFPHGLSLHFDLVCVVNETVEDRVGKSGVADHLVPVVDGELALDQGGAVAVAVVEDLQQVEALFVGPGSQSPVEDQEVHLVECQGSRKNTPLSSSGENPSSNWSKNGGQVTTPLSQLYKEYMLTPKRPATSRTKYLRSVTCWVAYRPEFHRVPFARHRHLHGPSILPDKVSMAAHIQAEGWGYLGTWI